jgi:hypothetical protein
MVVCDLSYLNHRHSIQIKTAAGRLWQWIIRWGKYQPPTTIKKHRELSRPTPFQRVTPSGWRHFRQRVRCPQLIQPPANLAESQRSILPDPFPRVIAVFREGSTPK